MVAYHVSQPLPHTEENCEPGDYAHKFTLNFGYLWEVDRCALQRYVLFRWD